MNVLFIDTACGTHVLLSVGGESYYAENYFNAGSEILMPVIDDLLKAAGCTLNDIDVFGACVGPGSFTGLRIGLSTIKAFCYALGKPCFGVNNLRLLSYNNNGGKVISVADAGNNVCYIAEYDGDAEVLPCKCVTIADAKAYIAARPDRKVCADNKLGGVFGGTMGIGRSEMETALNKHVGNLLGYTELMPLYVRKAQPERGEGDL